MAGWRDSEKLRTTRIQTRVMMRRFERIESDLFLMYIISPLLFVKSDPMQHHDVMQQEIVYRTPRHNKEFGKVCGRCRDAVVMLHRRVARAPIKTCLVIRAVIDSEHRNMKSWMAVVVQCSHGVLLIIEERRRTCAPPHVIPP